MGRRSSGAGGSWVTGEIATDLGPDWPFAGTAFQAFTLSAEALTCRLEVRADEVMPASIGWHPWFVRRPEGLAGELELEFEAGAMYVRDAEGIATAELVTPPPGPWDDCFTDVRRPPLLRWPGFLELTIESDCPDWVVYTEPRGRDVRGAPDGAARRAQRGARDRRAGAPAGRRDDLALETARGLTGQLPGVVIAVTSDSPRASCGSVRAATCVAVILPTASGTTAAMSLARSTTTSGVMPSCQMRRPIGREPLDRPDPQGRVVRQREFAEDRPGAIGLDPDDLRPAGVLERPGHDLRRAGGAGVDEDDERQVRRERRPAGPRAWSPCRRRPAR